MPKIFDKFTEKIPTLGEGGGFKPVGPKSQLLPKICFGGFPDDDHNQQEEEDAAAAAMMNSDKAAEVKKVEAVVDHVQANKSKEQVRFLLQWGNILLPFSPPTI